jgi:hypothetical protein
MTFRRSAALACVVAAAATTLAACAKPAPNVTVWSGTASVHREARCWSFEPTGTIDGPSCAPDAQTTGTIKVSPDTIGISVDPVVADVGWIPVLEGKPLVAVPLKVTYYSFSLSEADLQAVKRLQVVSLSADGKSARGVWYFQLTPSR